MSWITDTSTSDTGDSASSAAAVAAEEEQEDSEDEEEEDSLLVLFLAIWASVEEMSSTVGIDGGDEDTVSPVTAGVVDANANVEEG